MNVAISWSGGKDSYLALQKSIELGFVPTVLVCMLNDNTDHSRSNGVNLQILKLQAESLKLPIIFEKTFWVDYRENLLNTLLTAKHSFDCVGCVFGDIDIIEHRRFEEEICEAASLIAILPLWGLTRQQIINCNAQMNVQSKVIVVDNKFVQLNLLGVNYNELEFDLLRLNNIDLCGECGEFHTVVFDAPLFEFKIKLSAGVLYNLKTVTLIDYNGSKS